MVVDRSRRPCLLCGQYFTGRTFLCRGCADEHRGKLIPAQVRQQFYEAIDHTYPDWSNTYGHYNPPHSLLDVVRSLPHDVSILEIGAGGGFTIESLQRAGFSRLVGSDLTRTTLDAMRVRLPQIPLVAADAETLPFRDESFDVLLSSDLIEHLPHLDHHLGEAARILRPGGMYLIKTPNRLMAEAYYRLRGLYDAYFWHPSMCSPSELRAALHRHGLECRFVSAPRLTAAQSRKIPVRTLRPIATRLPVGWLPVSLRVHLEVVARKRS